MKTATLVASTVFALALGLTNMAQAAHPVYWPRPVARTVAAITAPRVVYVNPPVRHVQVVPVTYNYAPSRVGYTYRLDGTPVIVPTTGVTYYRTSVSTYPVPTTATLLIP
ncbi:MAG: hypothetical protein R3E01_25390 [Pirellulaceae bacterium]|nr:hypothetical protein [Planctomycetales bacterium]MCA9266688.1 hypothetical protein [Planctomycetales bacterium]